MPRPNSELPRSGYPLLLCSVLLTIPSLAFSHPNHGVSWGERYLRIDLAPASVHLVYGLTLTAQAGQKIRSQADRDHNYDISEAEANSYGREYLTRLQRGVRLDVDGESEELRWSPPVFVGFTGFNQRGPVAIETTADLDLRAGTHHRLVLTDGAEFEGIYRTTAKIALAPEVTLKASGRGTKARGLQQRVVFLDLPEEGPPQRRVLSAVFEVPGGGCSAALGGLIGAASVGLVILLFVLLRRRGRRQPTTAPGTDTGP